jgi:DNA-binding winged helix-turn-helix (wHTH) protein
VPLAFGAFTFDVDSRQLLRNDREVHLSPKAFDLLTALVDARPRVLTKDQLHHRLWPDTFVSDTNLASLIAEIREALGDDARQPRFVRTAQRVGYAFCGAVAGASAPAPLDDAPDAATASSLCWLIIDGRRVPLQPGNNILGRDGDGVIRIDSPTVSRRHARIEIAPHAATLEDLGSKNGTRLKGTPVSAAVALCDGDEIRIGSVVLRFRRASGTRTATWSEA